MTYLQLTYEQEAFLDHHSIPLSKVFDAEGISKKEYQRAMKELDRMIAIGVTPCREAGHVMRFKSGHCAQCNPQNFEFIRRHYKKGDIYMAGSKMGEVVKVGFASSTKGRVMTLNSAEYGGFNDWKILLHFKSDNAGKVEFAIHKALKDFVSPKKYLKQGREVECLEIFSCSYTKVRHVIDELGAQFKIYDLQEQEEVSEYNFSNIRFLEVDGENYKRKGNLGKKFGFENANIGDGAQKIKYDLGLLVNEELITPPQQFVDEKEDDIGMLNKEKSFIGTEKSFSQSRDALRALSNKSTLLMLCLCISIILALFFLFAIYFN